MVSASLAVVTAGQGYTLKCPYTEMLIDLFIIWKKQNKTKKSLYKSKFSNFVSS